MKQCKDLSFHYEGEDAFCNVLQTRRRVSEEMPELLIYCPAVGGNVVVVTSPSAPSVLAVPLL